MKTHKMFIGLATALVALAVPSAVIRAEPPATIVNIEDVSVKGFVVLEVAVPRGINIAARQGNADWALEFTVAYDDVNGALQIDSGVIALPDTFDVGPGDNGTELVVFFFFLSRGAGNTPSFSGTVELITP